MRTTPDNSLLSTAPNTSATINPDKPMPTVAPNHEVIEIGFPGLLSEVTSPVVVEGFSGPTFEQHLTVMVTDTEGNVLAQQPASIEADLGLPGAFSALLEFSIAGPQPGRISVFDTSARDGGLVHLASVPVTLLAGGEPVITVGGWEEEQIRIDSPGFSSEVQGGEVIVTGYSVYFFEGNLSLAVCGNWEGTFVEPVCGSTENVLAVGYATIESPDIGLPGPFSGSVGYTVAEPTPGRVVVYAQSPMDGGIEHLSSVPVLLLP